MALDTMKVNVTLGPKDIGLLVKAMACMPPRGEAGEVRAVTPQLVLLTALRQMVNK